VPGGIRTPNLLIRSQKLYPVELQAQRHCRFSILSGDELRSSKDRKAREFSDTRGIAKENGMVPFPEIGNLKSEIENEFAR
jgi:hypothetical protein